MGLRCGASAPPSPAPCQGCSPPPTRAATSLPVASPSSSLLRFCPVTFAPFSGSAPGASPAPPSAPRDASALGGGLTSAESPAPQSFIGGSLHSKDCNDVGKPDRKKSWCFCRKAGLGDLIFPLLQKEGRDMARCRGNKGGERGGGGWAAYSFLGKSGIPIDYAG